MSYALPIKNMVCDRCILVVSGILERLGLAPLRVDLGHVELPDRPDAPTMERLEEELRSVGFELIGDRTSRLIEQVKNVVRAYVDLDHGGRRRERFSDHLVRHIPKDYATLSALFSTVEGITIQQYLIRVRIEKAKELLVYDELSLTQIADRLGYSSVAHLSGQFRAITGLSPTHFRRVGAARRKGLDKA